MLSPQSRSSGQFGGGGGFFFLEVSLSSTFLLVTREPAARLIATFFGMTIS
jgi:hypothetical protein